MDSICKINMNKVKIVQFLCFCPVGVADCKGVLGLEVGAGIEKA